MVGRARRFFLRPCTPWPRPAGAERERLAALAGVVGTGGVVGGSEFLRLREMVRVKLGGRERKAPSLVRR